MWTPRVLLLVLLAMVGLSRAAENGNRSAEPGKARMVQRILEGHFVKKAVFPGAGHALIGTFKNGLIQWNGSNFTFLTPTNSDFPKAIIWDMALDRAGRLWIGSNRGLIQFDRGRFRIYDSSNSPMPSDNVVAVAVGRSNKVWLACSVSGHSAFMSLDGESWKVFTPEKVKVPFNLVHAVVVDVEDRAWIAVSEGVNRTSLIRMTGNAHAVFSAADFGFPVFWFGRLVTDAKSALCFNIDYALSSNGVDSSSPRLARYDGHWRVVELPHPYPSVAGVTPALGVSTLNVDSAGRAWVTDGRKLLSTDGQHWTSYPLPELAEAIFDVAFDPSGKIWVCTGSGIYIMEEY